MKKTVTKKNPRTRIDDLPLRGITGEELDLVVGGDPEHDCTTGSGAKCGADDCGKVHQSKCF